MTLAAPQREAAGLEPRERLEVLCDPGSFAPLRSGVLSSGVGERAEPGDGVVVGAGRVGGRPIFCYAQDPRFMAGSLGEVHADSIVRVMELASRAKAPVIAFVESGGARLQEGHGALGGYGRIFRASVGLAPQVPQISIITGVSAGGGSYSPALTDFVLMTEQARMFLTGPRVVQAALGEEVTMEDLGGPDVHGRNGVCQLTAPSDADAIVLARELLGFLPQHVGDPAPVAAPASAGGGHPGAPGPAQARRVYDVRDVARRIFDDGHLLELSPRWAQNMVTALARLDGRPVGVLANQPWRLGGVIDAAAAEKAALFVNTCNRFRLPMAVLVDTPGFMPGRRQEAAGVIRYGADLLRAFAGATVPRVTVVLRKAYGGAVITMNSKDLGADMVFAWPEAEIGIMAAQQAVGVVHRRRLAEFDHDGRTKADLIAAYEEDHLSAAKAAERGFIDEVIPPGDTRERLSWAISSLEGR
jgi:acetyl-CoA carboxylase carboxyltransferase component